MIEFIGPHKEFIEDETHSEIDLEGARFSGKTWACCEKVRRSCLKYPGIEWHIGRYAGEETKTKVKPEFERICRLQGTDLEWDNNAQAFLFPEVDGKRSRVYAYGLKAQSIEAVVSKVRGMGVACVWNDQTEELPQAVSEELRFATRQPGYPHQLIFSPNPPSEDSYIADQFPEECTPQNPNRPFAHRRYMHVSLYDNAHNLPPNKIGELEALYPTTHAKYKSLVLGLRGPNVTGIPIYGKTSSQIGLFDRAVHQGPLQHNKHTLFLQAVQAGQHHPVWLAAQLSNAGGIELLGGVMGKRMFLEDFLPIAHRYKLEWFDPREDNERLCADPPPSVNNASNRFTDLDILRNMGLKPRSKANANAPDVREATIQNIASLMRRYGGVKINSDPARWLTVTPDVTKQSKSMIDSLEGSYVWDEHFVSVANRRVRQPKFDQWIEGWMRGLENLVLNFCSARVETKPRERLQRGPTISPENSWML
jgi:hypothetical protein